MNVSLSAVPVGRMQEIAPGVIACGVIAAAASFLSQHYGAPVMLFALLLGLSMNFLSAESVCAPGVAFTASTVLRCGVALLGLRITFGDVSALGWQPLVGVVAAVATTILLSIALARLLGFSWHFGLLTGGATAICGASAAVALAGTLPPHLHSERSTSFTVIGVSTLSTLAMVLYPIVTRVLGLDPVQAGMFLGGTIHDVAQVVGAGYGMSKTTGDTATVIKLVRVAMLLPVITVTVMLTRSRGAAPGARRPALIPWFVSAFAVLVVVNSLGWIPRPVASAGGTLSAACLVAAIAAIGVKTQFKQLMTVGLKPVLLMIGQTLLLALLVLGLLRLHG